MTKRRTAKEVQPVDKSRTLNMEVHPGKTRDRAMTDLLAQGLVSNASAAAQFHKSEYPDVSLTDLLASLKENGEAVNRGDFAAAERMLTAQAVTLNAIFGDLARRAAMLVECNLHATEIYLRLALKAQSQSRSTIETLAEIKNPPVGFARQANFASGPQQVNNGSTAESRPVHAGAHPGETVSPPSGLSGRSHELLTDDSASQATGRAHPSLETVGALDRAAHG
jgi:hypothetical protein